MASVHWPRSDPPRCRASVEALNLVDSYMPRCLGHHATCLGLGGPRAIMDRPCGATYDEM
ncbi:Hypothetical predicted protein [Olea europaea subsp. europaea]|uniref:Uncharacterized protein n=1 Tax=Olea europaea subsp. europaea TaxID=158383 RepID=A0A8S0TVI5_OLEEU|nr:Hypothetical predicted protein [Olea europaea subsp. europaea]